MNATHSHHALGLTHYTLRITHYAPLAALILLAIYPILTGGLPSTGDGLNHFYRFAELDWHVRHGDLYPRWFSNMHYGFGAPVLNFYAPLSYYIPLLFRIFNLPLATSLQLAYALALALAILGAYKWAEELTPAHPAASPSLHPLITAAAYGLAPYFYFNIFHRGAYPETWALAIAPWILWAIHKAARYPNPNSYLLITGLISALILTHTISALIFLPIAVVYAIALFRLHHTPTPHALRFTLHALLSFALTAFFTLPLVFESQYIQLSRTYSTGDLDYHRNFLTLSTLLSPPPDFDPRLVFNAMPPSLPWPQIVLGLIAVGSWLLARRQDRSIVPRHSPFVIGHLSFVIMLSALSLSFTEPLWNAVPVSRFIQFPWRLVGPASLFLAALAGLAGRQSADDSKQSLWDRLLPPAFCLLFFLFSLPWTYHAPSANPTRATPADTIHYEIASGQLGTASAAEYLPRWVAELPDANTLLPRFAGSDLPSRLGPLPESVSHYESRTTLKAEELTYTASAPFSLTFDIFYFPGWVAALDGRPVNIQPSSPYGLITIAVPAGEHRLRLSLQPTAPQLVGALVSGLALLAWVVSAVRKKITVENQQAAGTQFVSRPWPVVALCALLIMARALYFDRAETIFHHTSLNSLPNPTSANFENQLELIGYEYAPQAVSGDQLPVTLYWRAAQPLGTDYSVSVQLADRFGNRFGQSDSQHPGGVPTSRWRLDQYARDSHQLTSLLGTPPGNYRLLITVYSDHPLSLIQNGAPAGVEYELGTLSLRRPQAQPPGPLTLVDFELATDSVQVGDQLAFTALWNSGEGPQPGLAATVELTDDSGRTLFHESRPPAGPDYPSDQWTPDELIRYPFSLTLPPDLPQGAARLRLSLTDASGVVAAGPFDLGSITITVPERSFEIPPMQRRVAHDFNDAIRLLGYDLGPTSITLYWQSLRAVSTRLTVFVHALDEGGAFASGHDAPPARPTTGWLPGEVIVDEHPIKLADRFEIGLYDPITGERFGEAFVTRR